VARSDLKRVAKARTRIVAAERELVQALVAAHESGETYRDIGLEAGLSHQRVHEIVTAELARREREGG
jgi:hypothetical protein